MFIVRSSFILVTSALLAQVISVHSGNLTSTGLANLTTSAQSPLLRCLRFGLSKDAVLEVVGQPGFLNDSIRYSTLESPSFKVVAKVASEHDIAVSVSDLSACWIWFS